MSCRMMLQTRDEENPNIKGLTSPKKLIHLKLIYSMLEQINFVEDSEDKYDSSILEPDVLGSNLIMYLSG